MPFAARITDPVTHPLPPILSPGIGSPNVLIGFLFAWRALPDAVGAAVAQLSDTMNSFMTTPVLTPADATAKLTQIATDTGSLVKEAPGAGAAATSGMSALQTTNGTLTTAWTTASAAPGGQPAANQAYTEGIKAAAAASATATFTALAAGGGVDQHLCVTPCPIPPHGPGFVTKGSPTVKINGLPLARMGDQVMEAAGGSNPITNGFARVNVDGGSSSDSGGGGDGAGGGGPGGDGGGEGSGPGTEPEQNYDVMVLYPGEEPVYTTIDQFTNTTDTVNCRGKELRQQQRAASCGEAAAGMVINDKGGTPVSEDDLVKKAASRNAYDPKNGTPTYEVEKQLNENGVNTKETDEVMNVGTVERATKNGPAVMLMGNPPHYVVVDGVRTNPDGSKSLEIRDPYYPPDGTGCREIKVGSDEWNNRVKGQGAQITPTAK